MSFAMSPAARERLDAIRASPLYPQIQAMNRRLNEMSKQNNYRDPVGNPEYDQLKSELFALQDQAAGGSPTSDMSQPPPFGGGLGGLLSRFDPRRMKGRWFWRHGWQKAPSSFFWRRSVWRTQAFPRNVSRHAYFYEPNEAAFF